MSNRSYNEVLGFLGHISLKDYLKIPREEISKLMLGKDEDYQFSFDPKRKLSEQNISKEAYAIFTRLYYQYIADENERKGIEEMVKLGKRIPRTKTNTTSKPSSKRSELDERP